MSRQKLTQNFSGGFRSLIGIYIYIYLYCCEITELLSKRAKQRTESIGDLFSDRRSMPGHKGHWQRQRNACRCRKGEGKTVHPPGWTP